MPISYWSAALNMLAWKAGLSYGKIQVWAQFHPEEYGKWMHELRLSYEKAAEDGTLKDGSHTDPCRLPQSQPQRKVAVFQSKILPQYQNSLFAHFAPAGILLGSAFPKPCLCGLRR